MFCSKCGKSLPSEGNNCPSCGHPIGQSRFEGSPYTSAQMHILPGDDVRQTVTQSYTRTTYTSMGDEEMTGDVDTRTTYRPAYGGDSLPEDMRRDIQSSASAEDAPPADEEPEAADAAEAPAAEDRPDDDLSDDARSSLDAMDETLRMDGPDLSKYVAQPIESVGQSGISADLSELLQELGSDTPRRSRRSRRAAYDDFVDEAEVQPEQAAQPAPEADAAEPHPVADNPDGDMEIAADYPDDFASDDDQPEVFDDIDEDEFDELRHSSFSISRLVKILVSLVAASAIIVGGLMWANHIRGNQSSAPIENVSEDFYNAGIAMIEAHAAQESTEKIMTAYTSGGYASLNTALQTSSTELTALLPEEATENEKLFLDALNKIENNIANCITSDVIAVSTNNAQAVAESDDRWSVVSNSVTMLKNARSAAELTAIINGQEIDVVEAQASPTPTPPVNYNTLTKGDKSDEVFEMQNRLYQLGFLLDDRDGAFGSKTQTAVKIFQQYAGLPITGIADSDTLAALYADDAPRTEYAQPTSAPAGN